MGSPVAPTVEEWRDLYEQARLFLQRKPWDGLSDERLFAVEEPGTKEVAYCSIMGAAGLEYGLAAYRGAAGLRAYALTVSEALDEDEMLLVQDCLTFYLGDREQLFPSDREVQKALGLRFRGRGAWPLFRSHRPGLLPALPTGQEVRFLSTCLEQTSALVQEITPGKSPAELPPAEAFVARRRDDDGIWRTTSLPFPPLPPLPGLEAGEDRLKLSRELPRAGLAWEAAVQALAPIAGEDGAPFWAWLLLCVDQKTGFIFMGEMGGPEQTVQGQFLSIVERAGFLPEKLRVTSGLLEAQLAPVTTALRIEVRHVKRLPELQRASKSLKAALRGR